MEEKKTQGKNATKKRKEKTRRKSARKKKQGKETSCLRKVAAGKKRRKKKREPKNQENTRKKWGKKPKRFFFWIPGFRPGLARVFQPSPGRDHRWPTQLCGQPTSLTGEQGEGVGGSVWDQG